MGGVLDGRGVLMIVVTWLGVHKSLLARWRLVVVCSSVVVACQ